MLTNIKRHISKTIMIALLLLPVVAVAGVTSVSAAESNASIDKSLCKGAQLDVTSSEDCDINADEPGQKVNNLIAVIINVFSVVVGVVAVIMIIVGGFRYITSGGDSGNVTGAKNTILYAVIGLIIVALAQFVVKFVISKTTEATTT